LAGAVSLTPGAELYGGFHANHFTIDEAIIGKDATDPWKDPVGGQFSMERILISY